MVPSPCYVCVGVWVGEEDGEGRVGVQTRTHRALHVHIDPHTICTYQERGRETRGASAYTRTVMSSCAVAVRAMRAAVGCWICISCSSTCFVVGVWYLLFVFCWFDGGRVVLVCTCLGASICVGGSGSQPTHPNPTNSDPHHYIYTHTRTCPSLVILICPAPPTSIFRVPRGPERGGRWSWVELEWGLGGGLLSARPIDRGSFPTTHPRTHTQMHTPASPLPYCVHTQVRLEHILQALGGRAVHHQGVRLGDDVGVRRHQPCGGRHGFPTAAAALLLFSSGGLGG